MKKDGFQNHSRTYRWLIVALFCLGLFPVYGETRFDGLDLAKDNRLLFSAETQAPGYPDYRSLFVANVEKSTITQLSFYPERLFLIGSGTGLQIQNRFGVFRSTSGFTGFAPVADTPSFVSGSEIGTGKLFPAASSPDGRYLLSLQPVSAAYGELVLYDTVGKKKVLISEKMELSTTRLPATWSPNSQFFVYAKTGKLFYYSLGQLQEDRLINEAYRQIGDGLITNAYWGTQSELYLASGTQIYRVFSEEFFTRSLYAGIMKIGTIIGKLPFSFDPNFDRFWISPDGTKLLLSKNERNLFLYYISSDDYLSTGETMALPYLFLPRNTRVTKVVWPQSNIITVLTSSILQGSTQSTVFRLDLSTTPSGDAPRDFSATADKGVRDIALSPDGSLMALVADKGVTIVNAKDWTLNQRIAHPSPRWVLWRSAQDLIIAGDSYIESFETKGKVSTFLAFSQVEAYGYSEDGVIQARSGGKTMSLVEGVWKPAAEYKTVEASVASDSYRVYVDSGASYSYRNMIMIRTITGYGTTALFKAPAKPYESFPAREETVDFKNFIHGSRIRSRDVSLVFNAIDDVQGLTEVLNVLSEYGIRATFFVNGEFIRRHPGAVREIAESGHEVGSLFYAYVNMTDARFRVDADFIKRGLAKNEDDYYSVTGKELSLLWHAPYYFINSDILAASRDMSYTYVGRDVDPLDWVTKQDAASSAQVYQPYPELIERIISTKKPGAVIPIRLGVPEGGRDDYLFQHLDILLNSLISLGYRVVPVSTLMEMAR